MPSALGNYLVKTLVSSPLHPLLGKSFAVITVTGRRSGKQISTPVNIVRVNGTIMIISKRSRTWWRNLRSGQPASLRNAGKITTVSGKVIEIPAEVAHGLEEYFIQYPDFAKYYNVRLSGGKPDPQDLEVASSERVIIQMYPAGQ